MSYLRNTVRINQMDLWKLQLILVTVCAFVQTYMGMAFRVEEDGGLATDWQDPTLDIGLTEAVDSLMKRSKALRFYGLMGKRSGVGKPIKVERRKGEMFVGLMGRSISDDDSLQRMRPSPTTAFDVVDKSNKQGSQEEWVQIIY